MAAITPGIQPKQVRIETIKMLPHPLSKTAKGGKTMARITRKTLILTGFYIGYSSFLIQLKYTIFNKKSPPKSKGSGANQTIALRSF